MEAVCCEQSGDSYQFLLFHDVLFVFMFSMCLLLPVSVQGCQFRLCEQLFFGQIDKKFYSDYSDFTESIIKMN